MLDDVLEDFVELNQDTTEEQSCYRS